MPLIPNANRFIKNNTYNNNEHSYELYDSHGYLAFSAAGHPLAGKSGVVTLHRYIASLKIGRWLRSDEDAHHKDENKRNNHWRNLKVMTRSEHIIHHRTKGLVPKKVAYHNKCVTCGRLFVFTRITQKYCSNDCAHENTKKIDLTRSELIKYLKYNSLSDIGRAFGVTCNAVKNLCKKYGVFYT